VLKNVWKKKVRAANHMPKRRGMRKGLSSPLAARFRRRTSWGARNVEETAVESAPRQVVWEPNIQKRKRGLQAGTYGRRDKRTHEAGGKGLWATKKGLPKAKSRKGGATHGTDEKAGKKDTKGAPSTIEKRLVTSMGNFAWCYLRG